MEIWEIISSLTTPFELNAKFLKVLREIYFTSFDYLVFYVMFLWLLRGGHTLIDAANGKDLEDPLLDTKM